MPCLWFRVLSAPDHCRVAWSALFASMESAWVLCACNLHADLLCPIKLMEPFYAGELWVSASIGLKQTIRLWVV